MHWYGYLLFLVLVVLMFAAPAAVIYGFVWLGQHPQERDWRTRVSKLGVIYSALLPIGILVFWGGAPHSGLPHPDVYRWEPVGVIGSLPPLLFAMFGKEWRIRTAHAIVGLGGMAFMSISVITL